MGRATCRYDVQFVTIHGHRRAFVKAGKGPAVLLLHGLGCDHTTWDAVIEPLARRYTVIAPDLLGHGQSDKPRADYTLGGYANGMRDLLTVLGIDKVTVVGHSFGGGVAMQFAYQFPERTERLMLVASGGLGPEVSPGDPGDQHARLRPGDERARRCPGSGTSAWPGCGRWRPAPGRRPATSTRSPSIYDTFKDSRRRQAIRHVVRAVVDWQGQIVTMADRAYLTEAMPMWVVWGRDDRVIPVRHASNAAALAPRARVEVIPDAGHFPHKDHPQRFVKIVSSSSAPPSRRRTPGRGSARCSRPARPPRRCTRSETA